MQINFYPEQNNENYEKAAREFRKLWDEEGKKITKAIEKISSLKFKETIINALIYNDVSYSMPLQLEAGLSWENKKGELIHELCHRLIAGNNIKFSELPKDPIQWNVEIHKPVMLILYDIWTTLYGEDFAKNVVTYEISVWTEGETNPYKVVWDWALSISKEERRKEFKKYFRS